ncbi:response regulator transcription factor [Candidatus Dojkabacteria bacterium]|nr:response regulator transcription factor [Candidatus Dojkabacteria bacterium]
MNILIIEDNKKLAENIKSVLKSENYNVEIALKGEEGLEKILTGSYNLVILDLALPDIDGIEICRRLRKKGVRTPILMLTARIDLESKVEGLDCGADDYITKPFDMEELLARIRALLRRNSRMKSSTITINDSVQVDLAEKSVKKAGKKIRLSPMEMRIIEFLLINRNKVKNASEIYEHVWGCHDSDILFSDSLKVHVSRIRKKLGGNTIKTVGGFGYLIE